MTLSGPQPAVPPLLLLIAMADAADRHLTAQCLERLGHQVVEVDSAEGVIDGALKRGFDIIFTDGALLDDQGAEASSRLKAAMPAPLFPLVVHVQYGGTGHPDPQGTGFAPAVVIGGPLSGQDAAAIVDSVQASRASPDESCLGKLRLLFEDGGFPELIAGFRESVLSTLVQLDTEIALANQERITHLAHSLKGSAGTIGFSGVARASAQLEYAARMLSLDDCRAATVQLQQLCLLALPHLQAIEQGT